MRKEHAVRQRDAQNDGIGIGKIIVAVINPGKKRSFQVFRDVTVFGFTKPAQALRMPMRSEPFASDGDDGIAPDLPHLV